MSAEPYTFIDPDGDRLTVESDDGDARVSVSYLRGPAQSALVPAFLVPEVAQCIVAALYEAVGLPVPELVAPVGSLPDPPSITMRDGEDWHALVTRAQRQHDSAYPDPQAVQAAAWAATGGGA